MNKQGKAVDSSWHKWARQESPILWQILQKNVCWPAGCWCCCGFCWSSCQELCRTLQIPSHV